MSDHLPHLPPELWRQIFIILRDEGDDHWQDLSKSSQDQRRSTLVPIVLTQGYFRNIAEPLLYEHAVLYLQKRGSRLGTVVDALQAKEERRKWVKTVVATWRPASRKDVDDESRNEFSILVETALALIPEIQELRLFRTLLSNEVYQWIVTNPTLRTLILQRCDFTQKGRHKIDLTKSNITALTLTQSSPFLRFPFGEVSKLFALPHLAELTITAPFFDHITTLLLAFPTPKLHGLRKLTVQRPSGSPGTRDKAVHLFDFLAHSPNLTHLLVQTGVTVHASDIPTCTMEDLKVLQGPANVVDALRPDPDAGCLDTLTVNGMLERTTASLFKGTIRHLSLDIGIDMVSASVLECPELLSLDLRLRPEERATNLVALSHAVAVPVSIYSTSDLGETFSSFPRRRSGCKPRRRKNLQVFPTLNAFLCNSAPSSQSIEPLLE